MGWVGGQLMPAEDCPMPTGSKQPVRHVHTAGIRGRSSTFPYCLGNSQLGGDHSTACRTFSL